MGGHWEFKPIISLLIQAPTLTVADGLKLPPELGRWEGIMLAIIHSQKEAADVDWRPGLALMAYLGSLSQGKLLGLLPVIPKTYEKKVVTFRHTNVGGTSASVWRIEHIS